MKIAGGCSCGDVRYQVEESLSSRCFCHCESCRRACGAPFVAWGTTPVSDFEVTSGTMTFYRSSPKVRRGFCQLCGTSLTYANEASASTLDVALATLDDPNRIKPEFHIWLDDKLEWVSIADGLPTYPGWRTG